MSKPLITRLAISSVLLLAVGILGGVILDRQISHTDVVPQSGISKFELITEAWDTTRQIYVDRTSTDPTKLAYGAIDGMINSLGDTGHSRFLTPEEVKQQQNFEKGQLEGVGIEVQEKNGQVVIVAPIEGSPAQKAGLRPGEIILKVDGKPVTSLGDAVQRILGPAGTSVTLTLQSTPGETRDVTLVRARIDIKSVTWHQLPGTSFTHIRISSFSTGTTADLRSALSAIKQQGTSGIVIDLRDDPGGLLDEATGTTSEFLKTGNVLLEKSADGTIKQVPVKPSSDVVADTPLVVLVNGGTASAAEIVAGALQDNGRAKLIGETTFGTGTVLGQYSLSDGSAILLATEEWLTPKGRTIWHTGLTPDVVVALPQNTAPLTPEAEADMTKDQLDSSGDQQLLQAISMLNTGP